MKTKDWGAFFLLALGVAAVWFWASGKAGAVWAAINGQTNAANPSGASKIMQNAGSGVQLNPYSPPLSGQSPLPLGYSSANASQSPITSLLQSTAPGLLQGQESISNNFNLKQFVPPIFVQGYANQPNTQTVPNTTTSVPVFV